MTHYVIVLMAISILAVGCAAQTRLPNRSASALDAQLEDDWKYWMTQHPEMATVFGLSGAEYALDGLFGSRYRWTHRLFKKQSGPIESHQPE